MENNIFKILQLVLIFKKIISEVLICGVGDSGIYFYEKSKKGRQ
jgi:hypothetical protein